MQEKIYILQFCHREHRVHRECRNNTLMYIYNIFIYVKFTINLFFDYSFVSSSSAYSASPREMHLSKNQRGLHLSGISLWSL